MTHVGDRVNETDGVEGELDKVTLSCGSVQIVTDKITSVLDFLLTGLQNERIGRLDMVVDDVVWENTTLTLRQEEERELLIKLRLSWRRLVGVVDVKDAAS